MSAIQRRVAGRAAATTLLVASLLAGAAAAGSQSEPFTGAKVNAGTVTCSEQAGKLVLTLSDDFVVPDTPAPHWQVVDSRGDAHLLERLVVKGDVLHKSITLPPHVTDVRKVQIWCAWAETLLGETELACGPGAVVHVTAPFRGPKANKGTVTHAWDGGRSLLTLSKDFVVPDTPAPHWRLIDSSGNAYLLNRLVVKDDKLNATIEVPRWVPDVAKVQIWCAWAETVLGEASFAQPVM